MKSIVQKRLASSYKQNDLSSIQWDNIPTATDEVVKALGANATYRYGIATDNDVGLPVSKHVLIPILTNTMSPQDLTDAAARTATMVGRFAINSANAYVPYNKAQATRFYKDAFNAEYSARNTTGPIRIDNSTQLDLRWEGMDDSIAFLTMLTIALNYRQLKHQYPEIPDNYVVLGAHAIGMAYRSGLLEVVGGREFTFVGISIQDQNTFKIHSLEESYTNRGNAVWHVNDTIAKNALKAQQQLLELGLALVVGAGATHYSVNHTTGGRILSGQNVKALTIAGQFNINPQATEPTAEDQTSFYYNILHPINKRGVACLIFDNSYVYTWYRSPFVPCPPVMVADAFMRYRTRLTPAGCHKVYVCILALRAIIDAGLGVFLPDPNIVQRLMQVYDDILKSGARGHLGSQYYTDEPSIANSAEADPFVPIAAYFVTRRMAASSLAQSPHFAAQLADAADSRWKAIVDQTTQVSLIDASKDQITRYLNTTGISVARYDLATDDGIAQAVAQNKQMSVNLNTLMMGGERIKPAPTTVPTSQSLTLPSAMSIFPPSGDSSPRAPGQT